MFKFQRIAFAIFIAGFAWLVCIFLGTVVLTGTHVPILDNFGDFTRQFAFVIGILVGGLWYFTNRTVV